MDTYNIIKKTLNKHMKYTVLDIYSTKTTSSNPPVIYIKSKAAGKHIHKKSTEYPILKRTK